MTADTITAVKKALEGAEQFIVNGVELGYIRMPDPGTTDSAHQTLPMIRHALSTLDVDPELTCPHIDKLVQSGELSLEAIQELERVRDINSMLRYGLWHEKARAEEAETKAVGLEAELALSKPVYSRRQIEARVKSLEEALEPFAKIASDGFGSALPNDAPLAIVNANMPDLPQWLAKVRGVVTQGDCRRARAALSSTGDTHGN